MPEIRESCRAIAFLNTRLAIAADEPLNLERCCVGWQCDNFVTQMLFVPATLAESQQSDQATPIFRNQSEAQGIPVCPESDHSPLNTVISEILIKNSIFNEYNLSIDKKITSNYGG